MFYLYCIYPYIIINVTKVITNLITQTILLKRIELFEQKLECRIDLIIPLLKCKAYRKLIQFHIRISHGRLGQTIAL